MRSFPHTTITLESSVLEITFPIIECYFFFWSDVFQRLKEHHVSLANDSCFTGLTCASNLCGALGSGGESDQGGATGASGSTGAAGTSGAAGGGGGVAGTSTSGSTPSAFTYRVGDL